jgi:hypothetical protein
MQFTKAVRKRAKLRLALSGPSGSGKTYGALLIAKGVVGKIAVIDTERGSASLYSDVVEFDTLEVAPPFTPERCIEALSAAAQAGYDVCVFDSITHEWDGAGGCLEINEQIAHAKFRGNTWAAWNETTPRHRAFLDAILQSPMHVIATMRSKTETVQGDDKKVKKLGMKAIQREGAEYEFTVVLDLEHEKHFAIASKDRTPLFKEPFVITPGTGRSLVEWLESGTVVAPTGAPEPRQEQPLTPAQILGKRMVDALEVGIDEATVEVFEEGLKDKQVAEAAWKLLTHDEQKRIGAILKRANPPAGHRNAAETA